MEESKQDIQLQQELRDILKGNNLTGRDENSETDLLMENSNIIYDNEANNLRVQAKNQLEDKIIDEHSNKSMTGNVTDKKNNYFKSGEDRKSDNNENNQGVANDEDSKLAEGKLFNPSDANSSRKSIDNHEDHKDDNITTVPKEDVLDASTHLPKDEEEDNKPQEMSNNLIKDVTS